MARLMILGKRNQSGTGSPCSDTVLHSYRRADAPAAGYGKSDGSRSRRLPGNPVQKHVSALFYKLHGNAGLIG